MHLKVDRAILQKPSPPPPPQPCVVPIYLIYFPANPCVDEGKNNPTQSIYYQLQGGFFNWPPPPHARLNRAPHGLAVHEEGGAS